MFDFMKTTPHILFSFVGRIGRAQFWFGYLLALVLPNLVSFAVEGSLFPEDYEHQGVLIATHVICFVIGAAVVTKRLRDLGWSAWFAVPLIGLQYLYAIAAHAGVLPAIAVTSVMMIGFVALALEMIVCGLLPGKSGPSLTTASPRDVANARAPS